MFFHLSLPDLVKWKTNSPTGIIANLELGLRDDQLNHGWQVCAFSPGVHYQRTDSALVNRVFRTAAYGSTGGNKAGRSDCGDPGQTGSGSRWGYDPRLAREQPENLHDSPNDQSTLWTLVAGRPCRSSCRRLLSGPISAQELKHQGEQNWGVCFGLYREGNDGYGVSGRSKSTWVTGRTVPMPGISKVAKAPVRGG